MLAHQSQKGTVMLSLSGRFYPVKEELNCRCACLASTCTVHGHEIPAEHVWLAPNLETKETTWQSLRYSCSVRNHNTPETRRSSSLDPPRGRS